MHPVQVEMTQFCCAAKYSARLKSTIDCGESLAGLRSSNAYNPKRACHPSWMNVVNAASWPGTANALVNMPGHRHGIRTVHAETVDQHRTCCHETEAGDHVLIEQQVPADLRSNVSHLPNRDCTIGQFTEADGSRPRRLIPGCGRNAEQQRDRHRANSTRYRHAPPCWSSVHGTLSAPSARPIAIPCRREPVRRE